MNTKYIVGLLMVLAAACKDDASIFGRDAEITASDGEIGGPMGGAMGNTDGSAGMTGGAAGTNGSGSSGSTGGTCGTFSACAGDVVGTWDVSSSCLQTKGQADIRYLGLACQSAEITGAVNVTGTMTLNADGTYIDDTFTTGSDTWVLEEPCFRMAVLTTCVSFGTVLKDTLSNFGYEDFRCVDAAAGGCSCQGKIQRRGGMGVLSNLDPNERYAVAGNTLSFGDVLAYSYCTKGNEMVASPQPAYWSSTPYTGTIGLRKIAN